MSESRSSGRSMGRAKRRSGQPRHKKDEKPRIVHGKGGSNGQSNLTQVNQKDKGCVPAKSKQNKKEENQKNQRKKNKKFTTGNTPTKNW